MPEFLLFFFQVLTTSLSSQESAPQMPPLLSATWQPEQMLKLPQPAGFNTKEQRGSTLSFLQMSKVLTLSLRLSLALTRGISSQLLYLQSCPFGHYPHDHR